MAHIERFDVAAIPNHEPQPTAQRSTPSVPDFTITMSSVSIARHRWEDGPIACVCECVSRSDPSF